MLEFKLEEDVKNKIEDLTKITKVISAIRLILGINLIVWVICFMSLQQYLLYGLISLASFFVMLIFVFFSNVYFKNLNLMKKKSKVYLMHYQRRKLDFSSFVDEGRDFLNKDDYKLADLDIFGSKSLFQYLNSCKTKLGRKLLAKMLTNPDKMPKEYTNCIYNMANDEKTLDIEAGLLEFDASAKNINYDEFNSIYKSKIEFNYLFLVPLLFFILTIVCLFLAIFKVIPIFNIIYLLVVNFLSTAFLLKNDIYSLDAFKYYNLCESYESLSNLIINLDFNSSYYDELKQKIKNNIDDLRRIKKVYLALSTRKNIVARIILNALFIYDFWLIFIINRLVKNLSSLDELFSAIAVIEVMTSFSNIGIDNEQYCISDDSSIIKGEEMYHPLVKDCISNSFTLSGGVILTGSNMSGKTTFMRTIGINQILYNASSIICAKSFSSSYLPIFTSLRANDMLSEGISTFYAEILRMKKMNEAILNGRCLILVDEIFKGTNAYERIEASLKIIDKFNSYNELFIISTHDFELCKAKNILNYHFTEHYVDDKIAFDYKIKEGQSESTNAMYLLKMSGII